MWSFILTGICVVVIILVAIVNEVGVRVGWWERGEEDKW